MYCDNCGSELRDGAKFCPKCGGKIVADSRYRSDDAQKNSTDFPNRVGAYDDGYSDIDDRSSGIDDYPRRKKNTKPILVSVAAVLAVTIVCAVVYLLVIMNSGMTSEKAYKKYYQVLEKNKDSIVEFENNSKANGVSIYDVNHTGIADVLYITKDEASEADSDRWYLHSLIDGEKDIEVDADADLSGGMEQNETLFLTGTDDYIYNKSENSLCRLVFEKGKDGKGKYLVEVLAQRVYDDEKEEYSYIIRTESGEMKTVSEDEYNQYVSDICGRHVTVLISALSEEELEKIFPSIDDIHSVSCEDAIKRLKDGDIAPVGKKDQSETPN